MESHDTSTASVAAWYLVGSIPVCWWQRFHTVANKTRR
eukprot:COSAG02_NODE_24964_length_672_cov_3.045375_1_plen_37_part_01